MQESQSLTDRELEILVLIAKGKSNKEIAQTLYISVNTVKVHLRNIFTKLEVVSRTEAAMWAVQNGLVAIREDAAEDAADISAADAPAPEPAETGRLRQLDTLLGRYKGGRAIGYSLLIVLFIALVWLIIPAFRPPPAGIDQEAYIAELEETRWKQLQDMPTARAGFAAAVYDNKIYAISGESIAGLSAANERYDPETDTWESLTPKPTPVTAAQAGVIGGKIYIPGGSQASNEFTNNLEIYDPRDDRWTTAAPLPVPLSEYALVTFEGKLFLFGGRTATGVIAATYVYDPGSDTWETRSPMPTARSFATAAEAGGKIFVIGGYDGQQALAAIEVYDVSLDDGQTSVWAVDPPMTAGRYRHGVARAGDNLVVLGGLNNNGGDSEISQWSILSGEWSPLTNPFTGNFSDMGIVTSGTQIFRIGGRINQTIIAQVFSYTAYYTVLLPIIEQ